MGVASMTDKKESPFSQVAHFYQERFIPIIPINPAGKVPGEYSNGSWHAMPGWAHYAERCPEDRWVNRWCSWPDANIGIPMGKAARLVGVDIDAQDKAVRDAIIAILPHSPVIKVGSKPGGTRFYQYSGEPNAKFRIDPKSPPVVELLSHGAQTVIPPSIHPDTKQPYVWQTRDTLENTDPEDLPTLPADIAEQLERVLDKFRTHEQRAEMQQRHIEPSGGSDYFRTINETALANLDAWVPDLIPEAKRNGDGYRMIATWHDSKRENVSIHPAGIQDWGHGRGMTAIDLVMEVKKCDIGQSCMLLAQKLGLQDNTLEWHDEPEYKAPVTDTVLSEMPLGLVTFGELIDAPPELPEMFWGNRALFRRARMLIAGAPKVGKSRFALSLLAAASCGGKFLGQQFSQPLRCVWLQAEIRSGFLKERLEPIARTLDDSELGLMRSNLLMSGRLRLDIMNNQDMEQIIKAVEASKPDILCIDPIINFSGANENDNQEVHALLSRCDWIGETYDCAIVLLHHCGKNKDPKEPFSAVRGASAFRGWYDTGILMSGDGNTTQIDYELRNGPSPASHGIEWYEEKGGYVFAAAIEDEAMQTGSKTLDGPTMIKAQPVFDRIAASGAAGIMYAELTRDVMKLQGLSQRAAERIIKVAVESSVVEQRQDGRKTLYFLSSFGA